MTYIFRYSTSALLRYSTDPSPEPAPDYESNKTDSLLVINDWQTLHREGICALARHHWFDHSFVTFSLSSLFLLSIPYTKIIFGYWCKWFLNSERDIHKHFHVSLSPFCVWRFLLPSYLTSSWVILTSFWHSKWETWWLLSFSLSPTLCFAGSWLILLHNDSHTTIVSSPFFTASAFRQSSDSHCDLFTFLQWSLTGHCASCQPSTLSAFSS